MPEDKCPDVVSSCICRWDAEDDRTAYFKKNYEEWLSQLPDYIRETVLYLLGKFDYYSHKRMSAILNELGDRLDGQEGFDRDTAIFTHIPSKRGIANSSTELLLEYALMHDISKFKIVINTSEFLRTHQAQLATYRSVVVIDDFCGSGESLASFIENNDWLKGKTLYYLIAHAMDRSLDVLQHAAETHGITLHTLYMNHTGRAFDDEAFSGDPCAVRDTFKNFSGKAGIPPCFQLGRSETEALVASYFDTPNNTLGIFWYDSACYFSLFPRERESGGPAKRPTPTAMRAAKKKRKIQNYNASIWRSYDGHE